ncbi:MAG: IPTL-CTERM sorting domain-containing protein [Thermodesulfobacteriota bacterium]
MLRQSRPLFRLLLFFVAAAGVFYFGTAEGRAQGNACALEVTKIAEGAPEGQLFEFQVELDGNIGFAEFPAGIPVPAIFGQAGPVTITEIPTPGWTLADVVCELNPGVTVTEIEGGAIFECLDPEGGFKGECTFVNVRVSNIPTLSEWGMIAAAAGLMMAGVWFAVRRKVRA